MGQNVNNVEVVSDYSTQEGCVRLHIDLMLTLTQANEVRELMDAGRHTEAFAFMRRHNSQANHGIINAFETAFAALLVARTQAAAA